LQTTSALYKQLIEDDNHWFETYVTIGGNTVPESVLKSVKTQNQLFNGNTPSIGNAVAAQIEVRLFDPGYSIPRMAEIRPYICVTNGTDTSEWIPQGVFYVDTRTITQNDDGLDILTLSGFDAMLKADQTYTQDTQEIASTVVKNIATMMGLQLSDIDGHVWDIIPINGGDTIQCSGEYTAREHLQYIAALYGGNWTMTNEGKLNLVRINDIPPETSLLTDEDGHTLNFGAAADNDTPNAQRVVV